MRKLWLPIRVTPSSFSVRAVDRDVLAEDVVVADLNPRRRPLIGDVLRLAADDHERGDRC